MKRKAGHDLLCMFLQILQVYLSHLMTKPTKWHVHPAKTQISLGIPQSDQSSLCAQMVAKDSSFLHADSEDSDQTGRTCHFVGFVKRRLIRHYAGSSARYMYVMFWLVFIKIPVFSQ